jgi:indole-3-glycerol phosphate synthase
MVPLVEYHEPENCHRVLAAGATLIGVNNRDLHSFEVDLEHVIRQRSCIPDDCVLVAESGIHGRADAIRLEQAGIDAMLVGEYLLVHANIPQAMRELVPATGDVLPESGPRTG